MIDRCDKCAKPGRFVLSAMRRGHDGTRRTLQEQVLCLEHAEKMWGQRLVGKRSRTHIDHLDQSGRLPS